MYVGSAFTLRARNPKKEQIRDHTLSTTPPFQHKCARQIFHHSAAHNHNSPHTKYSTHFSPFEMTPAFEVRHIGIHKGTILSRFCV